MASKLRKEAACGSAFISRMGIFYTIIASDANGGLVPLVVGYHIANKSKDSWRLMTQIFLQWCPGFIAVETREDGTTNKFVMIADMDNGNFEALQECPNLSQFFCQNQWSKNFPSTKNNRALYWKSFAMAEKGQVDDIIPKFSLEMREKIERYVYFID